MSREIQVVHLSGHSTNQQIEKDPGTCPICRFSQVPKPISGVTNKEGVVQLLYQCTNSSCGEAFIATYARDGIYKLAKLTPATFSKRVFSAEIESVSASFTSIYNQAFQAEAERLSEICGVGYRKSLEFLVKDYLISKDPEHAENIRTEFLQKCISDRVVETRIRICAERAYWLGNDETHYTRKWEDKDIGDLKSLIDLSVNWIESEIHTQKYLESMEKK